ncbi:uncharacterized protein CTRU02_214543 [Colletotrichum truncatum]|uniref:Uncharacterized protein n=1 Tax=Colletotrichum truncatum TaxID=5467 RepID=A0ACC3YEZ5_COLTU|nr:uncharacterized protein CTRU02_12215 [Colletotrichum truncatum]KAF6785004.1 hypothetical protein CTRU02_12215 [Colletotrichum truncatum]
MTLINSITNLPFRKPAQIPQESSPSLTSSSSDTMAFLVPVKESDISIVYDTNHRKLVLGARGEIPKVWFTPFFQQETLLGGLSFSIRDFAGGVPAQKGDKSFDISLDFPINLPLQHFNNKTVQIETANGSFPIEIKYTGFAPPPVIRGGKDNEEEGTTTRSVLTPINNFLPAPPHVLRITAQIPRIEAPATYDIKPSYNQVFLELVDTTAQEGSISWTFKWRELPTAEGTNPQLIDVTTHIYNGLVGHAAHNSYVIQGHIVHFVVFDKK